MSHPFHKVFLSSLIAIVITALAQAAITYSGVQDIPISITADGVYIDFTDPLNASAFTTSNTDPGAGNWDLNPFFGGAAFGNADTFEVATDTGVTNSTLQNFATSVFIGDGSGEGETFVTGFSGSTDHVNGAIGEFPNGVEAYLSFRIDDGSSGVYYG